MGYEWRESRWTMATLNPLSPIVVEAVPIGVSGDVWYAVRWLTRCLSKSGRWDHEPMPSSRTDRWLSGHRWTDLGAAKKAAEKVYRKMLADEAYVRRFTPISEAVR